MQVSTSFFYESMSRRMGTLASRADELNAQIAAGKRLTRPSQNPGDAARVAVFTRDQADASVYTTNLQLADSVLSQTDSVLGSVQTQLQRALELAGKAANGTLNTGNRQAIGAELNSVVDELVSLANSTDVRGRPLFGNEPGTQAVTRNPDDSIAYAPATASAIPVADGQSLQANERASRVFQANGVDILQRLAALATALQTGTADGSAARDALDDLAAAGEQVSTVRASVGARGARVELQQSLQTAVDTQRAEQRDVLEGATTADITAAVTELQKTMTVLQATQASFTKLAQLSLFDYLR